MIVGPAGVRSRGALRRAPRVWRAARGAALMLLVASTTGVTATAQIAVNRTEITFRNHSADPKVALVELHNQGAERVQASVHMEDWDRSPDGTNNWYPYATRPGSCDKALSVFPLSVSLEPGARQSIRVSMDSSASVPQECWAAAIVETVQPHTAGGRKIAYVIRTATKVYVHPESAAAAKGEVTELRIIGAQADSGRSDAQELSLEFRNTGGRHLIAPGEVQIRRPDNSIVTTVKLPILYTLPGARSATKVSLPVLAPGRYVIIAVLDYGGDELAAGQIEHIVH